MKILMRNGKHDKWQLVQSAAYGAESELQRLLADQPSLISVNEVREGAGNLVVAVREFPLEIGSIDLIGFTAEGDIAVIECKLASNVEIKRKVIGQVLEYGANLWGMSYEALDELIVSRTNKNLADLIREAVADPEWDEETFRTNIETALQSGNFILMIVVDEIREELSRIVRFVNDAGKPAFSFAALEMRRFQHNDAEMLVPHVFGSTRNPKFDQNRLPKKKWDESSFFETLQQQHPDSMQAAKKILQWMKGHQEITRIWWGEGGKTGSFVPVVHHKDRDHQLFAVYTSTGTLEVYFYWYKFKPPFVPDDKRKELLDMLNKIKGISLPAEAINKRPNIQLNVFNDGKTLDQLLAAFDWVIQEIIVS